MRSATARWSSAPAWGPLFLQPSLREAPPVVDRSAGAPELPRDLIARQALEYFHLDHGPQPVINRRKARQCVLYLLQRFGFGVGGSCVFGHLNLFGPAVERASMMDQQ